jgi:hypothetical protein
MGTSDKRCLGNLIVIYKEYVLPSDGTSKIVFRFADDDEVAMFAAGDNGREGRYYWYCDFGEPADF